jgi:TrmH family RNA methyltransferase
MMTTEIITSVHNPLVKRWRQLGKSSKQRHLEQSFLVEGTHSLMEALRCASALEVVGATADWQAKHPELVQEIYCQGLRLITLSPPVVASIATQVQPDGVVAIAPMRFIPPQITSFAVALWYIQDPGNMGTLIRSGVAAGIDGLIISGNSVDVTNPKIIRSTAGQWWRCPMHITDNFVLALQTYQQQGLQIVATRAGANRSLWQWDFTQPTILLLGNEGNGLSPELEQLADVCVAVPVQSAVESLNVAIVGALLMYEVLRQRRQGEA